MFLENCLIEPKIGIGPVKIGMNFEAVIQILRADNIIYSIGIDPNKGCVPEVPWKTIYIKNYMKLIFAEDVLWRIDFEGEFRGKLPNGIGIGTELTAAERMDSGLEYDEWNEDSYSADGYWLVDSADTGKIISISVGIDEINDDSFYTYDWIRRYR